MNVQSTGCLPRAVFNSYICYYIYSNKQPVTNVGIKTGARQACSAKRIGT